jgi:hypothetical protein
VLFRSLEACPMLVRMRAATVAFAAMPGRTARREAVGRGGRLRCRHVHERLPEHTRCRYRCHSSGHASQHPHGRAVGHGLRMASFAAGRPASGILVRRRHAVPQSLRLGHLPALRLESERVLTSRLSILLTAARVPSDSGRLRTVHERRKRGDMLFRSLPSGRVRGRGDEVRGTMTGGS